MTGALTTGWTAEGMIFCRTVVSVVLLLAGLTKAIDRGPGLASAIDSYRMLPRAAAHFVARTLGPAEIALGLLLFLGVVMPIPALAAGALLLLFAVAMAVNLLRARRIPCACFGLRNDRPISWPRVASTVTLAAMAFLSSGWSRWEWEWPLDPTLSSADVSSVDVTAAIMVAAGCLALLPLSQTVFSLISWNRELKASLGGLRVAQEKASVLHVVSSRVQQPTGRI